MKNFMQGYNRLNSLRLASNLDKMGVFRKNNPFGTEMKLIYLMLMWHMLYKATYIID